MPAITLNPGFIPILAGLVVLAAPRGFRAPTMALAAIASLWLLLGREFGAATAFAQMGLPVVLLSLDALNRIFGIALLLALVALAIYSSARRNRVEDAAILIMAGGAASALFVGDLVSFVAAAALAGLAAAWIVFCSPTAGAARAGIRLLVWNGIEGLLFLVGVAFHLSAGADNSVFERLDVGSIGGAFIFAALMVRVGAPLAHVWFKDTIAHASPAGASALSAFGALVGVYALARFYPAEEILVFVGAGMLVLGVAFALACDDLRAGAAYGVIAQTGVSVVLIGVGSPLALAAAEAHAFTSALAFCAFVMALGAVHEQRGAARLSSFSGMTGAMPITSALVILAGLAVSGAPGFALYASFSAGLEAVSAWELRWLWLMINGCAAALFVALTIRPALAAYQGFAGPTPRNEAPFTMQLGAGVAIFVCLIIGLAPDWLYGLMPTALAFAPYAPDRVAPHLELLGVAGAAFVLLSVVGAAPKPVALDFRDVDAFYRGPIAGAGRWAGVVMLRLYGAWRDVLRRTREQLGASAAAWARSCDKPYLGLGWNVMPLVAVVGVLALVLVSRHL